MLLLGIYITKEIENIYPHKNFYINVHSTIIHNSQKILQFECSPTDEWINKTYSAIKRDEKIIEVMIHDINR